MKTPVPGSTCETGGETMVMKETRVISRTVARRLAVEAQGLAGPRPRADTEGVMKVVSRLGCLQLDPINIVARSHLLVLWSRLGSYDQELLDLLLWQERRLFEYWAHAASIVLTQDYPIHQMRMRSYGKGSDAWSQQVSAWMQQNETLRISILSALQQRGPLRSRDFEDPVQVTWRSSGWTDGRTVGRMLDFIWAQGHILVSKRVGTQKWWDLAERCLPPALISQEPLAEDEVVCAAAQKALLALGVATARDITEHFTRYNYPGLTEVVAHLEAIGRILRVRVQEQSKDLAGTWFVHAEWLPVLDRLEQQTWEPRTTLLSPFDNLICDRKRTARLFDFIYQSEIYTPKDKRRFGYYVMPILSGDQLIGRIDPMFDRARKQLTINAVYAEPATSISRETGQAIAVAIEELAAFLGASTISYSHLKPEGWKRILT
jgi:uncharacterized protein YcaQ